MANDMLSQEDLLAIMEELDIPEDIAGAIVDFYGEVSAKDAYDLITTAQAIYNEKGLEELQQFFTAQPNITDAILQSPQVQQVVADQSVEDYIIPVYVAGKPCPRCGSTDSGAGTVQTRAADEASDQKLQCNVCQYVWLERA